MGRPAGKLACLLIVTGRGSEECIGLDGTEKAAELFCRHSVTSHETEELSKLGFTGSFESRDDGQVVRVRANSDRGS